ncbi:MAG: helix-turn-helix transcriptional regulator [Bacteroidota bacterium]
MRDVPIRLKFANQQNPQAGFDIVRIPDVYQREYEDHSPFALHLVEFFILVFITSGEGKHTVDFTDFPCQKGSLLTIRKDQLHKFFPSNLNGYLLLFTPEFLISYLERMEVQKSLQLFNELLGHPMIQLSEQEFDLVHQLVERIRQEYFDVNDEYSMSIIRSELHILITQLYRIKSSKKNVLGQRRYLDEFIELQQLVEQNATQTTRVQDYARMMGVSPKTLSNITKSIVFKSAKEFIDEICTLQIKRLLIHTELSIKEIAYASGFEETTNFYKYFKRQTQTTPEKFRLADGNNF